MKKRTEEQIVKKLNELWPGLNYDPEVRKRDDGGWSLTISDMYKTPGLDYERLDALVRWFGVKTIHDGGSHGFAGCETCDYGSQYCVELEVRGDA